MSLAPAVGPLGAPGVFVAPPEPVREITGVRRDIAAFVGVAPRGPAWLPPTTLEPDVDVSTWLATTRRRRSIPVRVTSWDEYRYHFGGFEGPGRLPYAVSAFFAARGEAADIVRIVHEHGDRLDDAAGRSSGVFRGVALPGGGDVGVSARSEGRWGDRLRVRMTFTSRPLAVRSATASRIVVDRREWVPGGSLLRLGLGGDVQELRHVDTSIEEPEPAGPGRIRVLTLAGAAAVPPETVEVVTARLEVVDADPTFSRREVLDDIGLRADHPRWLARVLVEESTMLWPGRAWTSGTLVVADPALPPAPVLGPDGEEHLVDGEDLWPAIRPEHFWDATWVAGDDEPGDGVHCIAERRDVGILVAPDLYDPRPLVPAADVTDPPTLCGPEFAPHEPLGPVVTPEAPVPGLDGLRLDPLVSGDLERIVRNQQQIVDFADASRELTVLLDVPLGLTHRRALTWRTRFDSPYAAAYHPWLDVAAPDDRRDALVRLNPSAFAAGIVAARERRLGVQHGPANELAIGAVRVADVVPRDRHDELHVNGINVFVGERDGISLTGARTLSRRPLLRQLSVARLMTVLRLSLEREMQWAVFEPNDRELWAEVRRLVHAFLSRLYDAGAFRGATTKEAFFVRCDDTTMTRNDLDNGRLVCLVGVAPAEPIEYIVLQMSLDAVTGVRVEVTG